MATVVSCIFHSDRDKSLSTLSKWYNTKVYLQVYVKNYQLYEFLQEKLSEFPMNRIQLEIMNDIRTESWAAKVDLQQCKLPELRNHEKDTIEHIWNTLHKIPCLSQCVRQNPYKTQYFLYIDFEVFDLFYDSRTERFMEEHFGQTHSMNQKLLFVGKPGEIYIPGCWGKLDKHFVCSPEFKHNIHWRFCGGLVFGSSQSILRLDKYYKQYFETYVVQHDYCLSWEVNYWTWLESCFSDEIKMKWYQGDHNDTLVRVENVFGFHTLKTSASHYKTYRYMYPSLTPYRPMTASVVYYKGEYIMNTRYVNYWIYDNGAYWYPEDEHKIRTKNICSLLKDGSEHHDTFYPTGFNETIEKFEPPILKRANVFSEGVEDIRLFVSQSTGKLMFIGSTLGYSNVDNIRMIVGEYNVEIANIEREDLEKTVPVTVIKHANMSNAYVISSPYNSWCEKNWCPVPLGEDEDGFIYKWNPLEIGKLVKGKQGIYDLEIVHRVATNTEIFGKVKGSTPFQKNSFGGPEAETELVGMVHYSEETSPRQYYNRIVVLDRDTYEVKRCSESFCFENIGVEFCMSMCNKPTKWVFWISQKDRDPMMIEIEKTFFDDKWIEF